jgi:hypothetical protein
MNYDIQLDIKFSFNNENYDSRRVLSTKTKFLDSYLYECRNLTAWFRYKDCKFRWEEVLFFLDIPMFKDDDLNLKLFSEKVQEKFNGNFFGLLKKIEIYFNQEDDDLNWKRKKEFSSWYRDFGNKK